MAGFKPHKIYFSSKEIVYSHKKDVFFGFCWRFYNILQSIYPGIENHSFSCNRKALFFCIEFTNDWQHCVEWEWGAVDGGRIYISEAEGLAYSHSTIHRAFTHNLSVVTVLSRCSTHFSLVSAREWKKLEVYSSVVDFLLVGMYS